MQPLLGKLYSGKAHIVQLIDQNGAKSESADLDVYSIEVYRVTMHYKFMTNMNSHNYVL